MALKDLERPRPSPRMMGRYDPRNRDGIALYLLGVAAIVAVLYMVLGDSFNGRRTTEEATSPRTTMSPAPPAPATK